MTVVSAVVMLLYLAAIGFVVAALFQRAAPRRSSPQRSWWSDGLARGFTPAGVRMIQIAVILWLAGVTVRVVSTLVRGAS